MQWYLNYVASEAENGGRHADTVATGDGCGQEWYQ